MLRQRTISIAQDRDILLEFHCRINYDSETPYARRMPYAEYRQKWLSTSQPRSYLANLAMSMKDERTIAEIWEEDGVIVGYLWVTFNYIPDYEVTIAEVMDIAVVPAYQRRGIAFQILQHAEQVARRHGATLLRSDTGIENVASQRLHEKLEFRSYRIHYEKILRYEKTGEPMPSERIIPALNEAKAILARYGYDYEISAEDLRAYSEADTFYPSAISWDELLRNRLIVAHEVVEIAELKRMGLAITKDVIVRNIEPVYEAHLKAAEIEMAIAQAMGNYMHIRDRLKAVQDWIEDPLVPSRLRGRYEELYVRIRHAVAHLSGY